jgi:ankyrin repeat protein
MDSIHEELIDAALENNLPEVRRLLSVGADVNANYYNDESGMKPLHRASHKGHVQVVIELIDHGADVEATTISGATPLHYACSKGRVAVVIELIGPNDSNGAPSSILGKRKSRGGANIEAKTDLGHTPLHLATWGGHPAIVKALLNGGANILAVNNEGDLPIHIAVRIRNSSRRNSEVAKYLLQHFYATTRRLPLHELVEDLTWIGDPDSRGVPQLRVAVHRHVLGTDDVVEILEFLVGQNPALLSSRDRDGLLPLHVACRRGASFSIVQSLVKHYQASVKSVSPQGDLPLFLACDIPEPSLDTIFILMKLYPDLVYR